MRERIKDRGGRSCGREKTKTGIRQGEVNMSQDMSMEKYIVGGSYSYGLYHYEYSQRDWIKIAQAFPTTWELDFATWTFF